MRKASSIMTALAICTAVLTSATRSATAVAPGFYDFGASPANSSRHARGSHPTQALPSAETSTAAANSTASVAAVALGTNHSCLITSAGSVKCWGDNTYGQLGDGTRSNRFTTVSVAGWTGTAIAITAGDRHTCALMIGGSVKCWGDNSIGQLGNGTNTFSYSPVDVAGLANGVTAISAGHNHTCAIVNGSAKCWGDNSSGLLGDGTTTQRLTPVAVSTLTGGVTAVSVGYDHTCVIVSGGVKCWGGRRIWSAWRWSRSVTVDSGKCQQSDKWRERHRGWIRSFMRSCEQRGEVLGPKAMGVWRRQDSCERGGTFHRSRGNFHAWLTQLCRNEGRRHPLLGL